MQLRFTASAARSDFMAALKRDDPCLFGRIRPLSSQPTVAVVDDVETTARSRLRSLLASTWGARVEVYDDTQFETFGL